LFQLLIENNEHIALVLDEYGVSAGIVTIEDLIETLIGQEIMDETDSVQDMQTLAKINRILKLKNLDKF
jgi:CBS domain containing-hemolysin-like protein